MSTLNSAVIEGRVTDAGGGTVTVTVDRETMLYPPVGANVRLLFDAEPNRPGRPFVSPPFDKPADLEALVLHNCITAFMQIANDERALRRVLDYLKDRFVRPLEDERRRAEGKPVYD